MILHSEASKVQHGKNLLAFSMKMLFQYANKYPEGELENSEMYNC